jgi:hypothetical protein
VQGLVKVVIPAAQDVIGQQLGTQQRIGDSPCRQRVLVMCRVPDRLYAERDLNALEARSG